MNNGHYGDITIDVSCSPYESGFKFNTLPFGGMTIDEGNAVRIGSAAEIKLTPPSGKAVVLETTGALPAPSAALRGAVFVVRGTSGIPDTVQVCLKSLLDTYSWKLLASG